METFDAVRTLLAVRQYKADPIPADAIVRILESAHLCASGMNAQPWHFVAVRDQDALQQLGRLVSTGPYVATAPFAVIVAVEKASRLGVSDGSRAIQSMMLTAWSEGIGSNWTGFSNLEGVREFAGIPATYDVIGVVPFGYPVAELGKGKKKRKPFSEVVSAEKFGRPFS